MWSEKRSLILSKGCVIFFMAALVVCAVLMPWAASESWRLEFLTDGQTTLFLVTMYAGCVPAAALLILLYRLLDRVGTERVFAKETVDCLRLISWCCFLGAAICFASFYWVPWLAVGVAAAFVGLIVRVVKNVIAKAIELQDDVDHTI